MSNQTENPVINQTENVESGGDTTGGISFNWDRGQSESLASKRSTELSQSSSTLENNGVLPKLDLFDSDTDGGNSAQGGDGSAIAGSASTTTDALGAGNREISADKTLDGVNQASASSERGDGKFSAPGEDQDGNSHKFQWDAAQARYASTTRSGSGGDQVSGQQPGARGPGRPPNDMEPGNPLPQPGSARSIVDGTEPDKPGSLRSIVDGTEPGKPGSLRSIVDGTEPGKPGSLRSIVDGTEPAKPGSARSIVDGTQPGAQGPGRPPTDVEPSNPGAKPGSGGDNTGGGGGQPSDLKPTPTPDTGQTTEDDRTATDAESKDFKNSDLSQQAEQAKDTAKQIGAPVSTTLQDGRTYIAKPDGSAEIIDYSKGTRMTRDAAGNVTIRKIG